MSNPETTHLIDIIRLVVREELAARDAELAKIREALKAMLLLHGKPHREEWLNLLAFEHALRVHEQTNAALAQTAGLRKGEGK